MPQARSGFTVAPLARYTINRHSNAPHRLLLLISPVDPLVLEGGYEGVGEKTVMDYLVDVASKLCTSDISNNLKEKDTRYLQNYVSAKASYLKDKIPVQTTVYGTTMRIYGDTTLREVVEYLLEMDPLSFFLSLLPEITEDECETMRQFAASSFLAENNDEIKNNGITRDFFANKREQDSLKEPAERLNKASSLNRAILEALSYLQSRPLLAKKKTSIEVPEAVIKVFDKMHNKAPEVKLYHIFPGKDRKAKIMPLASITLFGNKSVRTKDCLCITELKERPDIGFVNGDALLLVPSL